MVVYLEYECGCGQSYPGDPMIGVRFDDGATEEFWAEELRPGRRQEARSDPAHRLKFKDRLGQCYVLAGRYASHHEDVTLVHGSIQGFGNPRIDHAWVELPGDEVWEPTSGMTLPASVFAEIYHPEVHRRFSWDEVLKQTLRQQHWGPWD